MDDKHIFLKKAFVYKDNQQKFKDEFEGGDFVYEQLLGYWINKNNKEPALYDSAFPGPRTKKADIETGEDQKGE